MFNKTKVTKAKEIKRDWHLLDAKEKILGRLATQIAPLLMGKDKPYFTRHLDCGDYVVVINAQEVRVTGKKEEQKIYYRHSGYPGGLKAISLSKLRAEHPERIIIEAVSGMLPNNKLKAKMLTRLYVYPGGENPHQDKFPISNS
jgi:large subunit ribosomal protein L13